MHRGKSGGTDGDKEEDDEAWYGRLALVLSHASMEWSGRRCRRCRGATFCSLHIDLK